MKKLILSILLLVSFNAYAITTTTTGAGDWQTAGNWDNGVPSQSDDAVVNHAMTSGGNMTCNTLDNNSTITFNGVHSLTITGGQTLDNAGGTIDAGGNNITFTSSNTTKFLWQINSGTWTDGAGNHTFEYADLSINGNYTLFNSGTYTINQNCSMRMTTASDTWTVSATFTVSAGVTLVVGDGTNINSLTFTGDVNMVGTSGSRITIDGTSDKGYMTFSGAGNSGFDIQYTDITNGYLGWYFTSLSAAGSDTVTFSNNSVTGVALEGLTLSANTDGTFTFSDSSSYSNGRDGARIYDAAGLTININDFDFYSNAGENVDVQNSHASTNITFNRNKNYGGSSYGTYESDATPSGIVAYNSCLWYENTTANMIVYGGVAGCKLFNCTLADPATPTDDNIQIILASGDVCPITNTNFYGATRYNVRSLGVDDPVVTYTNANNATTAEYNGMTDPTGSNGNVDVDPKFTDAPGDDYSLLSSSTLLNTGTNTGAPANDITNTPWANANADIGCYTTLYVAPTSKGQVIFFF